MLSNVAHVWKVGLNFIDVEIDENENIKINMQVGNNMSNSFYLTEIKNGYLYGFDSQVSPSIIFARVPTNYENITMDLFRTERGYSTMKYNAYGGWSIVINGNTVLSLLADETRSSGSAKIYNLYYSYVWEFEDNDAGITSAMWKPGSYVEEESKFDDRNTSALLLEGCGCSYVAPTDKTFKERRYQEPEFKYITFSETIYYKVVMDEGYPTIVNSGTYVPPAESNIIIQPINR